MHKPDPMVIFQPSGRRVEYVELSMMKNFQDELIEAIDLPHRCDAFPHLADILPTVGGRDPDEPIRSGAG